MICDTCPRTTQNYYCEQPCSLCSKELDSLVGVSYGISNRSENLLELNCDNECLSDYLTISVEDDEWLSVLQNKITIEKVIDYDALLHYIENKNHEYCSEHNLCEYCRSKLVEIREPRGECFGTPVSEKMIICPHCGE